MRRFSNLFKEIDEPIPRCFRTTVLTDLYDTTKDIKQAQAAAGHTTAAMTLKHDVKGRQEHATSPRHCQRIRAWKLTEKLILENLDSPI